MQTIVEELQPFEHLTGTVEYNGDDWCIIIKAGEAWVDIVYITEKDRGNIYSAIKTPNLPTPIKKFIVALKTQQ